MTWNEFCEWMRLSDSPQLFDIFSSHNVAPSQRVPVARKGEVGNESALARWGGLMPSFAKGKPGQRCIVAASGFYEWQQCSDSRQPFYIHCADQNIFGFAGLWDRSESEDGTVLESCTIITMPANSLMAGVHNSQARMPAILPRDSRESWLFGNIEAAGAALVAYPADRMIAYPVSPRVNSARNNDETLLDPLKTDVD